MPDFKGDGTGYSARATGAMWDAVVDYKLYDYHYRKEVTTWEEFCEENGFRGEEGSYGFERDMIRWLEYEMTMPDEMWNLVVDLTNWDEIREALKEELERMNEEIRESQEEDDAE